MNELIKQHAPFVQSLARRMITKLSPNIELDDIYQAGLLGLAEALERYDANKHPNFEAFATYRVIGAMKDFLRQNDVLSRDHRRLLKKLEAAKARAEQRVGGPASAKDIAHELRISVETYYDLRNKFSGIISLVYLDDVMSEFDETAEPDKQIELKQLAAIALCALKTLPEREQRVLNAYYTDGLTLQEIAQQENVTESRISQLIHRAIKRLQTKLAPQPQKYRPPSFDVSDITRTWAGVRWG